MSCDPLIEASGLGKCYPVYDRPSDRLKEALAQPVRRAMGRSEQWLGQPFWALRHASFRICRGESVGVIGPNGSGKSTLLQLLYGTLRPSEGAVRVGGRMTALLELGAGFNPEYSGRENARLTGVLNGLAPAETERRLAEVEAFAELGTFFDRPVKLYSSGMYVRLAFAAAIHCDPEILIIDEALAVGDQYFQAKCYQKLRSLQAGGTTFLLVSHAMAQVKALCERALVVHQGRVVLDGPVDRAADHYMGLMLAPTAGAAGTRARGGEAAAAAVDAGPAVARGQIIASALQPAFGSRIASRFGSGEARFVDCILLQDGREVETFTTGRPGTIRAVLDVDRDCRTNGEVGVVVSTLEGVELFALNSLWEGLEVPPLEAGRTYVLDFEFKVPLGCDARYRVDLGYRMPVQGAYVDKVMSGAVFDVRSAGPRDVRLLFRVPSTVRLTEAETAPA